MSEGTKHIQQKFLSILRRESGDWIGKPIPAVTGNEDGLVDAGYGKIYVRLANGQEQTVLCSFNVDFDWHVKLGRLKSSPGIWRVREVRGTYLTMPPNRIGYHHTQHEGVDAPDRVMIDRRQTLQSTILVYNADTFEIIVGPNHAPTKTGLVSYIETILDISSYVPTEGAVFVNVEVDETGALSLHAGDPISSPVLADNSYVPVPDFEHYFVGTILLYETQAQLSNNDIRVPFPLSTNYLLDSAAFIDILVSVEDIQSAFEVLDTHTHEAGGLTYQALVYETDVPNKPLDCPTCNIEGALTTATRVGGAWIAPEDGVIQSVLIFCDSNGSSGDTIVDVNLNGTTIFTTSGNRPTFGNTDTVPIESAEPDIVDFIKGDILTWDIDAMATGAADLTVQVIAHGYNDMDFVTDEDGNPITVDLPVEAA